MSEKYTYYDDLEVGAVFGPFEYHLKEETIAEYLRALGIEDPIYIEEKEAKKQGFNGKIVPNTIATIYFMDSMNKAFSKRPPGGIHARQMFQFVNACMVGNTLATTLRITGKYIKKERKYVAIEGVTKNEEGEIIATESSIVIWAE